MGLSLSAVNRDYGFTKDGEDKKENEEYISTDCGYFSYKFFREDFMKFLTDGRICSFDELNIFFGDVWINDEKRYTVLIHLEDFEENEKDLPEVKEYLEKLDRLSKTYPNLYDCFAFIEHCDCEGEMPYEQLIPLVPHLKAYKESSNKKWGYSGWEYDWLKDLIDCCEKAIEHEGKLWFC